jgi:hypothetical protein
MTTKAKPAVSRYMPVVKQTVSVESWRTTAYVFFWSMCIFAIAMANIFVIPAMAKGPKIPGDPCGPFNRVSHIFQVHSINNNNVSIRLHVRIYKAFLTC